MKNGVGIWKLSGSRYRPMFILGMLMIWLALCDTGVQAAPMPQPILAEQTCPVCGMSPARYPQWQTQIVFKDGQNVAFDGGKDMFRFLLAPTDYPQHQGQANILAVWVHDFNSNEWIDGQTAYFVVGSDELGPMGKEIVPFADLPAAEAFIAAKGGKLAQFNEIDEQMLVGVGTTGHHHHGALEPTGVMGAHLHGAGNWMLSYRFMHMDMQGDRKGTSSVSTAEVLADYMVAPLDMTMDMHMLGAMYAPTDQLTLMAMVPFLDIEMHHITRMGMRFSTKASGLGDIKLSGLYSLYSSGAHRLHLNLGVSLPTGDIDRRDDTPVGTNQKLPYPMQLGSGTWDLLPGITYTGMAGTWSWGSQALATIRLGENSNDYTLGDRLEVTGWVGHKLCQASNLTLRLDGQTWGNIEGADPDLNPMMVPTADPDLRGGTRLDLLAGLDYMFHSGALAGSRLAIEGGLPIYQDLDGPQLETDLILTAGWQFMW